MTEQEQRDNKELKRDGFIFYRSYFEAIDCLPEENQLPIYKAIAEYALNNIISALEGIEKAVFLMAKPGLDTSMQNYLNGCKGGAPHGNKNAKKQPGLILENNPKQPVVEKKQTTKTTYKDKYIYKNKDKYKENKESIFLSKNTKEKNIPTLNQVQEFCLLQNLTINAEEFFNYYAGLGWKSGKTDIVDWQSLVKAWALNKKVKAPKQNKSSFDEDMQNTYKRLNEVDI